MAMTGTSFLVSVHSAWHLKLAVVSIYLPRAQVLKFHFHWEVAAEESGNQCQEVGPLGREPAVDKAIRLEFL